MPTITFDIDEGVFQTYLGNGVYAGIIANYPDGYRPESLVCTLVSRPAGSHVDPSAAWSSTDATYGYLEFTPDVAGDYVVRITATSDQGELTSSQDYTFSAYALPRSRESVVLVVAPSKATLIAPSSFACLREGHPLGVIEPGVVEGVVGGTLGLVPPVVVEQVLIPGPQGPQGIQGPQGPQGLVGPPGDDANAGTWIVARQVVLAGATLTSMSLPAPVLAGAEDSMTVSWIRIGYAQQVQGVGREFALSTDRQSVIINQVINADNDSVVQITYLADATGLSTLPHWASASGTTVSGATTSTVTLPAPLMTGGESLIYAAAYLAIPQSYQYNGVTVQQPTVVGITAGSLVVSPDRRTVSYTIPNTANGQPRWGNATGVTEYFTLYFPVLEAV